MAEEESSFFDFVSTVEPEVYFMMLLCLALCLVSWIAYKPNAYQSFVNAARGRSAQREEQQNQPRTHNTHVNQNLHGAENWNPSQRIPYKRNRIYNTSNHDVHLQSENTDLTRIVSEQNMQIKSLEKRLREVESEFKKERNTSTSRTNQIRVLEGKNRSLNDSCNKMEGELGTMRDEYNRLADLMENTRREKEDALRRLSQYVGERLVQNNPNIADLNDPYRPSKLAELSNEIYDNEWTSAYTCLNDNGVSDNECVLILLQIVMGIHRLCQENINNRIQALVAENEGSVTKIKEVMKKNGGTNQTYMCNVFLPNILKDLETSKPGISSSDEIKVYIKSCFELCWYMAIQDPPCVFQCYPGNGNDVTVPAGTKLSREFYKEYTKRGSIIDFIVWPIMLLDVKQPYRILSKGVAEGCKG